MKIKNIDQECIDLITHFEGFQPIQNFQGYEINKSGTVRSLDRERIFNSKGNKCFIKGKILKPTLSNKGYYYVSLGRKNKFLIHVLVAKTFIPNPENKKTVNHKDGNKLNCNDWNLEWATYSENNKHAYDTGLKIPYERLGSKNPKAKLTMENVIETKKLIGIKSLAEIGRIFGVSKSTIFNIKKGRTWAQTKS